MLIPLLLLQPVMLVLVLVRGLEGHAIGLDLGLVTLILVNTTGYIRV